MLLVETYFGGNPCGQRHELKNFVEKHVWSGTLSQPMFPYRDSGTFQVVAFVMFYSVDGRNAAPPGM